MSPDLAKLSSVGVVRLSMTGMGSDVAYHVVGYPDSFSNGSCLKPHVLHTGNEFFCRDTPISVSVEIDSFDLCHPMR